MHTYLHIYNIYIYTYTTHTYIYILLPTGRGCRPEVYHVPNSLGFVWGLFRVYLGFHLRFNFGFSRVFTTVLIICHFQDVGIGVLCFGNKSRQPFGHSADIPKCIKHWPCAVKTFPPW